MRVLAVGAHPDDVENQCAGTLAKCAQRGDDVVIAVVADGGCGSSTLSRVEISAVRKSEAQASADMIGAELIWLGVPDGSVFENEGSRRQFIDLVRQARPDFMIVHDPNDYNPDHVCAGRLATDASLMVTARNVVTDYPPAERIPSVFYMDTFAGIGFSPEVYVDTTDTFEVKRKMLLCHESQKLWMQHLLGMSITEGMEIVSRFRGLQCGVRYAEGFRQLTMYPRATTERLLP